MDEERKYYIYGYIRLDTNTYFYIGKGSNDRWKCLYDRSEHFKNIINKVDCVVEILYDNLTEKEAYELENALIEDLVFNESYSIETKEFKQRDDCHLVNQTWGGEGASGRAYIPNETTKQKLSDKYKGKVPVNGDGVPLHQLGKSEEGEKRRMERHKWNIENNPNYGMRGKHHTEESKQKIREKHTGRKSTLSEEELKQRGQKIKEIRENNNSYGCKDETKKKISETLKGKMTGVNNPTSKRIVCIDTGEIFDCCRDACKKYDLCPGNLSRCLKEGKRIKGLLFNYIL